MKYNFTEMYNSNLVLMRKKKKKEKKKQKKMTYMCSLNS